MTLLKTVPVLLALTLCARAETVEIDARGGVIPNSANADVRITSATGSGNYVTLATNAGNTVSVKSLQQAQSEMPAMVQMLPSQCLKLSGVGIENGASDLTIGDMPSEGTLAATGVGVTFEPVDVSANLTLNAVFTNATKVATKKGGGTVSAVGEFRASVDQTEGVMAYAIPSLIANAQMPYMTVSGAGLIYDFDSEGQMDGFGGSGSSVADSGKEAIVSTTDRKVAVPLRGFNVNGKTVVTLKNMTAYQPEVVEAAEYGEADTPDGFGVGVASEGVLKLDGGSLSAKLTVGSGSGGRGALVIDGGATVTNYCSMTNSECLFALNGYASLEIRRGRYVAGGWLGVAEESYAQALITVSTNGVFTMTPAEVRPSGFILGGADTYVSLLVEASGRFSAADASLGVNIPASSVTVAKEARVSAVDGGFIDMGDNRITSARAAVFNMTDGGIIRARSIDGGAFIQFNGGIYRASGDAEPLLDGTIWSFEKGATIDVVSGSSTISFASPILKPTGRGLLAVEIPESLTDKTFASAPYFSVVSTSGGGNGATVVCELDDTGRIANFRVTGRGSGYMQAKGILYYGNDKFDVGSEYFTWGDNVSGGLVKTGAGTLIMKGVNTYEGDTRIEGGKVVLNDAGVFSPESGLYLSGNGVLDLGGGEVTLANFGGDGSGSVVNGTLHLSGLVFDMEKVKGGEIETLNFSTNIVFDISAGVRLLNADETQLSRGNEYVLCKMVGEVPDRLPPIDKETYRNLSKPWGIQVRQNEQGEYTAVLRYFGGSLFIYY